MRKPRVGSTATWPTARPAVGARRVIGELAQVVRDWTLELTLAAREHGFLRALDPNVTSLIVLGAAETLLFEYFRGGKGEPVSMAETLIDRLALAVENARLYEQATLAAEREHIVNRIAQNVQEAESVDDILRAALADLSTVLGASRGIVQISPRDDGSHES